MVKKRRDIALAIDTGGTNVRAALVELDKGIVAQAKFKIGGYETREALAGDLVKTFGSMLEKNGIDMRRLAGIGHGSAGVPDEKGMYFTNAFNIPPHLLPLDLVPMIADAYSYGFGNYNLKAMSVLNDCSAGAMGESMFGWKPGEVVALPVRSRKKPGAFIVSPNLEIPKKFRNVCYYTISTGENAGFIHDGNVVGRPEMGHAVYGKRDFFGRKAVCSCRGTGHLEALHSGTGLANMILREYMNGKNAGKSLIWPEISKLEDRGAEYNDIAKRIPPILYDAARKGDRLALDIADWHAELTCRLIGHILASGYQPEIIAFGGSVTKSMDQSMMPALRKFSDSVAEDSRDYTGNQPFDQLPVLAVCKGYGDDHILLGAGASVFKKLYGTDV